MKITVLFAAVLLLSGCNAAKQPMQTLKQVGISTGEFLGVIDEPNTMKVPDYYSSNQIQKSYQYGRTYEIDHLDCHALKNNCK